MCAREEKLRIRQRNKLACIACGSKEGIIKERYGVNYYCIDHRGKNSSAKRESRSAAKKIAPVVCANCGINEFIPRNNSHRYCDKCAKKRKQYCGIINNRTPKLPHDKKCSCGADIEEFIGIPGKWICSNTGCRQRYISPESSPARA